MGLEITVLRKWRRDLAYINFVIQAAQATQATTAGNRYGETGEAPDILMPSVYPITMLAFDAKPLPAFRGRFGRH